MWVGHVICELSNMAPKMAAGVLKLSCFMFLRLGAS